MAKNLTDYSQNLWGIISQLFSVVITPEWIPSFFGFQVRLKYLLRSVRLSTAQFKCILKKPSHTIFFLQKTREECRKSKQALVGWFLMAMRWYTSSSIFFGFHSNSERSFSVCLMMYCITNTVTSL
jgi:hypothetical protein